MTRLATATAQLVLRSKNAYSQKWRFSALFVIIFGVTLALLAQLDLLPDAPAAVPSAVPTAASSVPAGPELPLKVEIPSIALSATISDPTTTDVAALDALLAKGAVWYPTSAKLNQNGNVVLFGHSSYLPVVINQAYKTFDGIQKLAAGDTITVYSATSSYVYSVRSVAHESANDAAIPLTVSGRELTLSTCDSFGKKTDRFVVTADFVSSSLQPH